MTENADSTPKRRRATFNKAHTPEERFWSHVDIQDPDGCWPWAAGLKPSGYGQTRWEGKITSAHRVAWTATFGPIPDGLWVLHDCDNRPCCNPGHLFLGDALDNVEDMDAKGRRVTPRGEESASAKLTAAQVLEIRAKLAAGVRGKVLAREFGISQPTVTQIKKRRLWAHLRN